MTTDVTITVTGMMAATMSVILMTMTLTRDGNDYSDGDSDYGSFNDDGTNGDDLLTVMIAVTVTMLLNVTIAVMLQILLTMMTVLIFMVLF